MPVSTGVKNEKEQIGKMEKILTVEEMEQYQMIIDRLTKSEEQRNEARKEFDDRSYIQDYYTNREIAYSYLQKKQNVDEVRVVTPLTEKKIEAVYNELLQLNLQPEVRTYDKDDNDLYELGKEITDVVERTNQIEKDDDLWEEFIYELLTQRAAFIEEQYLEETVEDKQTKTKKYTTRKCQKNLLSGLQVILGDITIPARLFDKQPYIFKYERVDISEARVRFGHLKNFIYVKAGNTNTEQNDYGFNYRLNNALQDTECEIIHYMCYPDDEYQCIINGVPMYGVDESLPWNHEGYNIKMTILKRIHNHFAYGKPLTASSKTLQAIDNETIRLMIRKFRQAIEPPIGVRKGKVLARDIFEAGKRTQGLSKGDFERLIEHQGITSADTAMWDIINSQIEQFIGVPNVMQGMETKGATATEIVSMKRQALKMLGNAFTAYARGKREATYLRIYNLLENKSKPVGKTIDPISKKVVDIYERFTLNDKYLEDGVKGKKIVQFTGRDLERKDKEAIYQYEKEQSDLGRPVEFTTINIEKVKQLYLNWYVIVVQKEKEGSDLDKAMFSDTLNQVGNISKLTGLKPKSESIVREFERVHNIKDMFEEPQAPESEDQVRGQANQAGNKLLEEIAMLEGGGNEMVKPEALGQQQKPSINTMASNV